MTTKILTAIALATVLTSCSSLYKATSTPDDVYYSPAPAVHTGDGVKGDDAGYDVYENYQSSNDDRYLRMKVQNNALWSTIDDYAYWQDSRYDFGFSCNASRYALLNSFYSPFASYGMYGSWSPLYGFGLGYGYYGFGGGAYWGSPYQTVVLYKNPKTYFGTTNKSNLTAYRNFQYVNNNYYKNNGGYNNNNTNNSIYSSRNNTYYNNNTNTYQPARSFSSSSSSNSAGGHSGGFNSSGSSAPVSRPTHH
ncbi:MAG TPA: hypothetical protein VG738_04065 [Chitinophagaceae bacterium]|nr:hypothetical protein [Chitinophagaceae bacterium]